MPQITREERKNALKTIYQPLVSFFDSGSFAGLTGQAYGRTAQEVRSDAASCQVKWLLLHVFVAYYNFCFSNLHRSLVAKLSCALHNTIR